MNLKPRHMKTRKTLSLIAFAMISTAAHSQIMPNNTAQVCAYWANGDSITYDCTSKTEEINRKGEKTITDSSSEKRTLTVIAEDEKSYTLQVSYKDVFSSNLSLTLNMSTEDYSDVCSSIKYNVITDEFGTIQSLGDLEQSLTAIKTLLPNTLEKIYAKVDKKAWKTLGTTKEQMIQQVTDAICTPEAISKSCLEDVSPLLFFHGGSFDMDKEYTVEEPFCDIFGDGQINAETHFWVDKEDSDSTYLVLRTYTKVDSERLMPLLVNASIALLKTTITDPDVDVEKLFKEKAAETHMGGELEQYTATMIHMPSGWTVQWISDRIITVYDDEGKEQTSIHKEAFLAEE